MTFRTFFYDILFSTFRSASGVRSQNSNIFNIFNTFLILLKIFGLVIFRTPVYVKPEKYPKVCQILQQADF